MKSPKEAGFVFLSLPLDQIAPLSLLAKAGNGIVTRTGASLSDLFLEKKRQKPPLMPDGSLPKEISGIEEFDLKIETHFKFLEGLAKLTRTQLDAELAANRTAKCSFTILDPLLDTVSSFEIDKYITANPLTKSISTFEELLRKNDLYIVTEIIKSKSFEITYDTASGKEAGAKVTVDKIVDVGASAGTNKQKKQTLKSGENGNYLAIAAKAVQLLYVKKWWQSKEEAKYHINLKPIIAEIYGPEDMECDYLEEEGGVINL
jgi:hypothetical protein